MHKTHKVKTNNVKKLNIFCLKWGDKYDNDWVIRLEKMCSKYVTIDFDFYCYTDKPFDGSEYNIECLDIPESDEYLEAWFHKLGLFNLKESEITEEGVWNIFFDLDLFFYKNLDNYIEDWANNIQQNDKNIGISWNPICIKRKNNKPVSWGAVNFNTSLIVWNDNTVMKKAYDLFMEDEFDAMINFTGLDMFLSTNDKCKELGIYDNIQKLEKSFKRVHHDYVMTYPEWGNDIKFEIKSDNDVYEFFINDNFPFLSFNGYSFNAKYLTTQSNKNNEIKRNKDTEYERYVIFNTFIKKFNFSLINNTEKEINFNEITDFIKGRTV